MLARVRISVWWVCQAVPSPWPPSHTQTGKYTRACAHAQTHTQANNHRHKHDTQTSTHTVTTKRHWKYARAHTCSVVITSRPSSTLRSSTPLNPIVTPHHVPQRHHISIRPAQHKHGPSKRHSRKQSSTPNRICKISAIDP